MFFFLKVLDCGNITLIGDGVCHDEANTAVCNYDGGDCCLDGNTEHCAECFCYIEEFCLSGFLPYSVGDGFCNDETNNAACHYDGGDCCGKVNADHCSECNCFLQETCAAGYPPVSVGDGFCNDENNNVHCNFDGLDCCQSPVNTSFCSECKCHGELTIAT